MVAIEPCTLYIVLNYILLHHVTLVYCHVAKYTNICSSDFVVAIEKGKRHLIMKGHFHSLFSLRSSSFIFLMCLNSNESQFLQDHISSFQCNAFHFRLVRCT